MQGCRLNSQQEVAKILSGLHRREGSRGLHQEALNPSDHRLFHSGGGFPCRRRQCHAKRALTGRHSPLREQERQSATHGPGLSRARTA